jgi:UDPglucose 6-dehydrogenase
VRFGPKIGIVGMGVVGSAIGRSCEFDTPITYDVDPDLGHHGTYKDLCTCEAVYICVPSPTKSDGTCDTSILEDVLDRLRDANGVLISKVTAPPDVYERLNKIYPNLVYSPEFLTEANAMADYRNSTFVIIGGRVNAYVNEATRIIKSDLKNIQSVITCGIKEAAFIKYTINSFLATKVVFMNEMQQLAKAAGIDYSELAKVLKIDNRIGPSHLQVPGPDGQFGFGGMCFPKDTQALLKYAESVNIELSVLETAVKKNTLLRLS